VRWGSVLQRDNPGQDPAEQNFTRAGSLEGATIRVPASMAMLDCLMAGALDWQELVKRVAAALKGKRGKLSEDEQAAMRSDLRILWRLGLLVPSCKLEG